MTPQELTVMKAITNLHQSVLNNDEPWDTVIYERLKIIEIAITNTDVKIKYNGIKQFLSLYGGMGSINDQVFSKDTDKLKNEAYKESFKLLKAYWKDLGNEHYIDDEFKILSIGTKVKLIPNTVRYFDNNEVSVYTPIDNNETITVWEIISNQNFDITNMPEYGIYANGIYSTARQSCIEVAAK